MKNYSENIQVIKLQNTAEGDTKKEVEALEKLYIYTKKNSILYKIACLYDWKEDEKNAIHIHRIFLISFFQIIVCTVKPVIPIMGYT